MNAQAYAAARAALLEMIAADLQADERIAAAWLYGSYGRATQDCVSDIDLYVVVAAGWEGELCARLADDASGSLTAGTTHPARRALFTRFGAPLNIHENQHNAPPGGSFSAVLYREPGLIVDWMLVPQAAAHRANDTRLLFDRVGVAVEPAPEAVTADNRPAALAERGAFFWMMAMVTAKYIYRGEALAVSNFLEMLADTLDDIIGLVGSEEQITHGQVYIERAEQARRLRELCDLTTQLGVEAAPRVAVEGLLELV
jgi:predicted nucleotidyltransferase